MKAQSQVMRQIVFDATVISDTNLGSILRDAARGEVPVRDLDAALNPTGWALALAQAVAESSLRPSLKRALATLFQSDEGHDVALALAVHSSQPLVDADLLWEILFARSNAKRFELAGGAASALITLSGLGALTFDVRLRDLLASRETPRPLVDMLLVLAGGHDRPWLLRRAELLVGDSDDDTLNRIGQVASSLGSNALEEFAHALATGLAARGRPLAKSVTDVVASMVEARRRAGL